MRSQLLAPLLTAASASMMTSHVVIRQVSLPALSCDSSTMGFIALNSFAVTSLCSAYVTCRPGEAGPPAEFSDLDSIGLSQARDIDCVGVCTCLERPAALSSTTQSGITIINSTGSETLSM